MKATVKVEVKHQTRKAYLVADADGRQGWIQARSMKSDGTVNADTFEKAATEFAAREASKQAAAAWQNDFHEVRADVETEKAFGTKVTFLSGDCEQEVARTLWFPKSVCRGFAVPGWMLEKKVEETLRSFPSCACAFLNPEDSDRLFN